MNFHIRYVKPEDKAGWYALDHHLPETGFDEKVTNKQGYVLLEDEKIIGILRYNLFWDNTPFCTLLFIDGEHRGKSHGRWLMEHWEQDMKSQGHWL